MKKFFIALDFALSVSVAVALITEAKAPESSIILSMSSKIGPESTPTGSSIEGSTKDPAPDPEAEPPNPTPEVSGIGKPASRSDLIRALNASISTFSSSVTSFKENEIGFSDFQGNVWEWTLTCWYASKDKKLKNYSTAELNTPRACTTRIVQGENRSHIPDFIVDTYSGGCATLEPAANLGFRLVLEEN